MRLDVGSNGMRRGDDWVDVDRSHAARPQIVADALALPFPDATFDELVAADVLEHVLPWQTHAALCEWRRVLVRGGVLRARVPNLQQLGGQLAAGVDIEQTIRNVYGGHRYGVDGSLDTHHHGWTPTTLATDLAACGFAVLSNDRALNMTVEAQRGY